MTRGNPKIRIESSLPRAWEVERTFNDVLYDWLESAPWLAISAAAHGMILLFLFYLPRELLGTPAPRPFVAAIEQAPENPFVDPLPPTEQARIDREPTEEPRLQDAEVSDHVETLREPATELAPGEAERLADAPFEGQGDSEVIGVQGGSGGAASAKYEPRRGGTRDLKTSAASAGTEVPLADGLRWLASHQSADGSWDCDGFMANCGHVQAGTTCDGPGEPQHDVGMTGLATLAFLGVGSTTRGGEYKEQVAKAVKWLKDQQDRDTGMFGERLVHSWMYDHAIATLAICEAYYFSHSPLLKRPAQDAINLIGRARNPYGAWRYDQPPSGESDTSVTGWCVFALASAKDGGLAIDPEGFVGASHWIDDVTDHETGRTGYNSVGSLSSRVPGLALQYPPDRGEAMTAVAILSRVFMGQEVEKLPVVEKGANLLRARLPEWDPAGTYNDIYYWYYGTYALFQLGGARWDAWNKSAKKALIDSQRRDGDAKGSWDPKDAWGRAGGRVYMTSLAVLCLEVYFRYGRVLGSR